MDACDGVVRASAEQTLEQRNEDQTDRRNAAARHELVHAYDLERTICDVIRRSETMDVSAFNYAVREYTKRRDKNYAKLIRYAAALRVEKKLREKMGVLF